MMRNAVVVLALAFTSACGGGSQKAADGNDQKVGGEEFGLSLAQLSERVEKTESAIGQCMTKAGFQYVPLDFASVQKAMSSDQSAPGLSDEQYTQQYGYGIATQFNKPIVVFGAGPQNSTIVDALPASDQVAYRRALWGEQPEWNLVHAIELEDLSLIGGCTRSAAQQFFSADELASAYKNPIDKLIAAEANSDFSL